jgi:hypothetical protein
MVRSWMDVRMAMDGWMIPSMHAWRADLHLEGGEEARVLVLKHLLQARAARARDRRAAAAEVGRVRTRPHARAAARRRRSNGPLIPQGPSRSPEPPPCPSRSLHLIPLPCPSPQGGTGRVEAIEEGASVSCVSAALFPAPRPVYTSRRPCALVFPQDCYRAARRPHVGLRPHALSDLRPRAAPRPRRRPRAAAREPPRLPPLPTNLWLEMDLRKAMSSSVGNLLSCPSQSALGARATWIRERRGVTFQDWMQVSVAIRAPSGSSSRALR